MANQSAKSINEKPYDLEPHVEATLAYLLPPFTGIAIFVMEKNSKFIKFHAMQSILFGISAFVLTTIANALIVIFIGVILAPLVTMGLFLAWLFVMWKAYEKEEYMLPIIGQVAKNYVDKG
jgi:uncharacterized membrane protein